MGKLIGLLVGIILIVMSFTGITVFLAGMEDQYNFGFTNTSNYTDVYASLNQTAEIEVVSNSLQAKIDAIGNNSGTITQFLGYVDLMFFGAWEGVKQAGRSIGIGTKMIESSTSVIPAVGTNNWIPVGLILAITIAITLILIGIAMRRDL